MRDCEDGKKNKYIIHGNNFCCVIDCYLQPSCYIMADVAEEALMASRVVTDVQVIHVMGSNSSPKLFPQLLLLLLESCCL